MIGLGIGLKFGGAATIDQQAQDHFNRVISDGGTIPAGLVGCDAWFKAVKGVYGVSDITSAISSGIHPHYLGYKAGAGSGATLGSAAQTCYNAIGAIGDVVQTTAASQPLILPHTGTNYVWLPGVNGNYFSTPNTAANQITGDFEATFKINLANYNVGSTNTICAKRTASQVAYHFAIVAGGNLFLRVSSAGDPSQVNASATSSISLTSVAVNSNSIWVKVYRESSTGNVTFYYSLVDGGSFTQLGSVQTTYVGGIFNLSSKLEVGSFADGLLSTFTGMINIGYISTSPNGIPSQIFNPANYSRATSATTWTSTTGEVWTLNTPSTNNALKAAIVDTTYLMGNGTSIGMRAASLNMTQTGVASYTAIRKFVNTIGSQIITELGTSISSSAGKYFGINFTASQEEFGVYANVGLNNSRYSSTSTALKLATQIIDINNANEASPYLINNLSQTFVAQDSVSNNTAAMNGTGYNLLARNNATSLWANVMMACDIVSKNADSTGTQTAMYSALKPFLVNCI